MPRSRRIEHCDSCGVEIIDSERRDCPACSNDTKCVECAPDGKPCLDCPCASKEMKPDGQ